MYDDLIKRMRLCEQFKCRECEYDKVMGCREKLNVEAADAIEELKQQVEHYHGCMNDWFEAAQEYKAAVPKWIPVTEWLPKEGVSVQVCFHSQGGIAQAVSERFVNDRNQSYWSGLCGMKPTHWMPLPQPPKEEIC